MNTERSKTQSIVVYVLFLSAVLAAIIGMQVYLKRGVQAKIKDLSDALLAPRSEHLEEVNTIVPLLDDVDLGGGKYAAKKSTSEAHLEESRREDNYTITFTKHPPRGEEYSSVSQTAYLVTDDPSKKVKASKLKTDARFYTAPIAVHKVTGVVDNADDIARIKIR